MPYLFVDVWIKLDNNLSLAQKVDITRIPDFLLESYLPKWLSEQQVDSLLAKIQLKSSVDDLTKRLEFNDQTGKYQWIVFNTLYKGKCLSNEEILHIDTKTGAVLKHFEEQHLLMHCF
ncbi:MAG: hypothetical protein V4721_00235 [Bacteroidota bacterium]